jgi:CheY-like chemotaxis protein
VREMDLRGRHILVLDDHPDARKAVALAIETLGGVPIEATSPEDARHLLAEMAPATPWAAVVDHDLSGEQTGPGFLDAYAACAGHALPAVIITGSTDASTLASLVSSGRPWLIKPIELNTLCLALSRLAGAEAVQ